MTDPQPPPEAALITERIEAIVPQPSRARLARQAGISPALWAKIEKGYDQPATGVRVPYTGSARAVAAMAAVLGITAGELRKRRRPDAAKILEASAPAPAPEDAPDLADLVSELRQVRATATRLEGKIDRFLAGRERGEKEGSHENDNGGRRAG